MGLAQLIESLVGLAIVVATLQDVFLTVVVPRRAPRLGRYVRISRYVIGGLWIKWRGIGLRFNTDERREAFLGTFGALALMVLLASWIASLVLGYGMLLDAMRSQIRPEPEGFGAVLYFSATSLLTLGYGDYVAQAGPARLVAIGAAATGLGIYAVSITLLFSLYGSFQKREVAVVILEAGAGAPPSGVTLLETYAQAGILDQLPKVFQDWQAWAAEVLETHLAYPILAYFRSSHTNDSWISSLGAVMDAAMLVLTTIEDGPRAWAKLSSAVGGHCLEDLVQYFDLPDEPEVGLEREEFDEARRRLGNAGFRLRDADESWARFSRQRMAYAGRVNALARHFASPPAQWIGDRSPLKFPSRHAGAPPVARPAAAASPSSTSES